MAKKIKQSGKEYNLIIYDFLKGTKCAFLVESKKTIFVSPSIFSLIESDPKLMQGKLKVLRMPVKAISKDPNVTVESGMQDKFENLETWIDDLRRSGTEVFFDKSQNKESK